MSADYSAEGLQALGGIVVEILPGWVNSEGEMLPARYKVFDRMEGPAVPEGSVSYEFARRQVAGSELRLLREAK